MAKLNIRLQTKDGNVMFNDSVTPQSTLSDLKMAVSNKTGIQLLNLKILHGYPPKVLASPDTDTLEICGVRSGDTLVIEAVDPVLEPSQPTKNCDKIAQTGIQSTSKSTNEIRHHVSENLCSKKGIIMRKEVPSDNSCLFTSVGFIISGTVDVTISGFLRQLIVETINTKPEIYTEGILGKSTEDYCNWILLPTSWGGSVELAIMSEHYGFEIVVANTTSGVLSRFGEDKSFETRVFLIFDGIHYDPLFMDFLDADDHIQTLFPSSNNDVFTEVEQLMMEAKSSKQYTDIYRFTLLCADCGKNLVGEADARQHASETGHTSFQETK